MAFPSSVMNYIHATPDYQAFARRIALDPDGEVESLRKLYNSRVLGQYNPNIARFAFNFSQLITEATMGSGLDPKVWKAFTRPGGLTDFYHDIIMEDGFLDQTPELIIIPFNGLSNIARVCNDDNIMDVGDKLLERVPVVWDILWEHRDAIIQNRGSSVRMVERSPPEVVVRMLRQYRVLYLVRNRSFERMGLKFMHLSLFCYFHLPGSKLALDALSCSSMEVNHGEPQHRDIQRFAAYVQEVAAVLGTEAIFRRLKKDIVNPKLPFFRDILSAISITSQILPDLEVRPFFGRLNMTKAVLDACMRELQTAERKLHPTVWYIGVDYIKVFFSKHDYNMIWGDDLMCRGDDVASILAQATKVCAVANPTTEWRRQSVFDVCGPLPIPDHVFLQRQM
ncbi:hypothetical protein OF83DRAFT_247701 [Amylostereum chailletii]|nr:hypothetical protein OF83DRAFT_247701 [Amylostereum chailletii]